MSPQPVLVEIDATNLNAMPCCGIKNPSHPGVSAKRRWLKSQFELGLKAKCLLDTDGKPRGYIEYLPGEYAWRGVNARGYMFIHCIWNHSRRNRNLGWATAMVKDCIDCARSAGMRGVAVMTREGPWAAGNALFERNEFELVDSAPLDNQLWAFKFKPKVPGPTFKKNFEMKASGIRDELTLIKSAQCPYISKFSEEIVQAAKQAYSLNPRVIELASSHDAQNAPTPYAVFSLISRGRVLADHQISRTRFCNIMRAEFARIRANHRYGLKTTRSPL